MSASTTSPVVTPRKGRHARSNLLLLSSPTHEATTTTTPSRFSSIQHSSSVLPANIDPLTLDPDDAFVRLSVREIQNIEGNLHSTHDQLSSRLRLLVSEKYRDMLGTANTLIEMSSSATNLVNRLDALRQGVEDNAKVIIGNRSTSSSLTTTAKEETSMESNDSSGQEETNKSELYAIAATTKLLAESPDDVWRAIDSIYLTGGPTLVPNKLALSGRDLTNYKAATILRAAWIYILCERAWTWLSEEAQIDDQVDIKTLFPYVSKQWSCLATMKTSITSASQLGLAGWFPMEAEGKRRWEDISSSYLATITFLLSAALLDNLTIKSTRDLLLKQRRLAIEERLQTDFTSPSVTLTRLVRCMAETMIYCFRAFAVNDGSSVLPHLANVFKDVSNSRKKNSGDDAEFPPGASQVLYTLPSASLFAQNLPSIVRTFAPRLDYEDSMECRETTVQILQNWSKDIREAGEKYLFAKIINKFSTISSIGEAQIQLREVLDRCCSLASKACKDEHTHLQNIIEQETKATVELLERLLLQRLNVLCQERTAELPAAASESISSALSSLAYKTNVNGNEMSKAHNLLVEATPTKFLFESDFAVSKLESRLRLQTPLIEMVLSSVEKKAKLLGEEMDAYAAYVQRDASKRAKRKERRKSQGLLERVPSTGQINKVLQSYRSAFDTARIILVDELRKRTAQLIEDRDMNSVKLLFIVRLASAFEHSELLKSSASVSAHGSDDNFLQRLRTIRREILDRWIIQIVQDSIDSYSTKVGQCPDPTSEQLGRPSAAFIESLMLLIDEIHHVGCGYQDELSLLGQQLLSTFVKCWLKLSSKLVGREKSWYEFDSCALGIISRGVELIKEESIADLKKVSANLDDTMTEELERALQRLRLVLLPLRPQQVISSQTNGDKREVTASAPPLPMLSIIQGKERAVLL